MNPAPPVTTMLTTGSGYATGTVARWTASSCRRPTSATRERALLLDAFDSNWIAPLGPARRRVRAGVRRDASAWPAAAALSSGTAALHLALVLLGVGPGDEVLVPTLTFVATANAVAYVGARPVFVDSDARHVEPRPDARRRGARRARGRRARLPAAVIAVDLYGQCADYDPIARVVRAPRRARRRGRRRGARRDLPRDGRPASFGALGVFSFNGNKIITTSGGGMLVADDPALIERARHLATQARDPAPHYEHSEIGFNYRMSNLLAALGRGQLAGLAGQGRDAARRSTRRYRDAFADVAGHRVHARRARRRAHHWLTVDHPRRAEFGVADAIREHLESLDIEARPAWKPMHLQPVFADCEMRGGAVAEEIFRTGLCLPSGSAMTDADVDRVVEGVLGYVVALA